MVRPRDLAPCSRRGSTRMAAGWEEPGGNRVDCKRPPGHACYGPGGQDAIAEIARARPAYPCVQGTKPTQITEAWCAGTQMISTTISTEGLGATSGQDILIADSPQEFAKAVLHACSHDEVSANAGCGSSASSATRRVGRNSMSPGCFRCKLPTCAEKRRPSWAARRSASPRSHRAGRRRLRA